MADLIRAFFAAFTSGPGCAERLAALPALFIPQAVIFKSHTVYDVDGFIAPRRDLLLGGALTDFHEWATDGRTDLFGDIAHHFGGYAKQGVQNGVPFTGAGRKSLQFVRTGTGWRISAVAWDDER